MNSEDYIADLEEEARTLRSRVTELEEELRQTREELRVALERKVEEVGSFVLPMRRRVGTTNTTVRSNVITRRTREFRQKRPSRVRIDPRKKRRLVLVSVS